MPMSSAPVPVAFPTGAVAWCWTGALTDTSFCIRAGVTGAAGLARVVVSTNSDYSSPAFTSAWKGATKGDGLQGSYRTLSFDVTGLAANTTYYYQIQFQNVPGQMAATRTIKTAMAQGSTGAFKFTVGSCSKLTPAIAVTSMNRSIIHQAMALEGALVFFHIDDILYTDCSSTDVRYQRDLNARLYNTSPDVAVLMALCPVMYLPGDHDMGPNDATLDIANAETIYRNSRTVYRETVPHYPFVQTTLGETNIDHVTLTQSVTFGKIRFLLLDAMSQARASANTALGQGLGNGDYWDQRSWLTTALAQAASDGMEWTFVCLPRGWMDYNQTSYADTFTAERTAICDIIEAADARVCLLYGDTHAVGFDDGTHVASFSTDGFAKFPGILASSMFNIAVGAGGTQTWNGSAKFSRVPTGTGASDGQYALFSVAADHKSWTVAAKGAPINEGNFAPTTLLASVSTSDVTPAVSFNNAAPSVAHGVPLTVNLDKTWFGTCSVHWVTSTGLSGDVTFKPNKTRASFSVLFANAGSPTITLSGAVGCTISGTNPATVTVT